MLLQDLFRGEDAVVTASPEATLREVVAKMQSGRVGAVVVTRGRKVIGVTRAIEPSLVEKI